VITDPSAPWLLAALALGYLLGSIPFGLLFTRMAGLGDVRAIGSGNIGATNVLRTGRKGLAAATLLGDALKGTVAVLVAARWGPDAALAAAAGAFLGHVFPVWLGFKGGKGVATFIGCLIGLSPPAALVFAAVWIGVALIFRLSSAGGLSASLASALALGWFVGPRALVVFLVLAAILWWKHEANIRRLMAGTEPRIGSKG
jgi:acyl phosphate:glycerol-3-phosphate acyltransferase